MAVSPDFLGTGASDRISPWPVDWWRKGAEQTACLIDHLGHEDAVLVGTSGGAVIALLSAVHFPEKVRGVVADSFAFRMTREMLEKNVLRERDFINEEKEQFWRAMHGPDWKHVVEEDTRMMEAFVEEKEGRWFPDGLGAISCPVLFTASREDSFIGDPIRNLSEAARELPRASLYLHHRGDHPLMWTAPEAFASVLEGFLRENGW
jgi:pimeloyl-ACP methyl ester carboxylesterase